MAAFGIVLGFAPAAHAQTYTSDGNIGDFTTTREISYATFSNFSCSADPSCAPTSPFTPTSSELATYGYRVYGGTFTAPGLSASNDWILASFNTPISSIVVFPNIDHYGSPYDGYQYQIFGSNDLKTWTFLYDSSSVSGDGEPFTLGTSTGTPPTTVNNVLTPESFGVSSSCSGTETPCAIGYIATFNFSSAYQYYAFGYSTEASASNSDQELSAVAAFVPQSGAELEIKGTVNAGESSMPIDLIVYDSQIHTGVVQAPAASPATFPTNCSAADQIPTDAYVLQAEAPTGCDPGDVNEANLSIIGSFKFVSPAGSAVAYEFDISTRYVCAPLTEEGICNAVIIGNTSGSVNSNDTGFLSVVDSGASAFSGTITLSGTPQGTACGTSTLTDTVSSGLTSGGGIAILALAHDSSDCGGFEAPQTLALNAGTPTAFEFGNDAYKITPINSNAGDKITFLPVPVPAGPLGLSTWGAGNFGSQPSPENPVASSPLRFAARNFPGQACVPFSDLSAVGNPVCPEIQLDCTSTAEVSDCGTFLYTSELDFAVDKNSLPNGVGGVEFLGIHAEECPSADFNINIFLSYTATAPDPVRGSSAGNSCFAATFDPTQPVVATGQTVTQENLNGFFLPVIDNPPNRIFLNRVEAGATVPLIWQTENSADKPVTNLTLCASSTGTGCTTPWVNVASASINCITGVFTGIPTTDLSLFNSGLVNLGRGFYAFLWKTPKTANLCETPVLTFSTGFVSYGVADFRLTP